MIGIHPVHRRLAEIAILANKTGFEGLPDEVQVEFIHCLTANANLVRRLDELKQLSYQAHIVGDYDWEMDLCQKIEKLEAPMR
ncbi:MAG: hypothetical protein K6T85_03140 [Gorillibacterium sp.]|nr:hypothetical protein [Gorillibacterium sp.]